MSSWSRRSIIRSYWSRKNWFWSCSSSSMKRSMKFTWNRPKLGSKTPNYTDIWNKINNSERVWSSRKVINISRSIAGTFLSKTNRSIWTRCTKSIRTRKRSSRRTRTKIGLLTLWISSCRIWLSSIWRRGWKIRSLRSMCC